MSLVERFRSTPPRRQLMLAAAGALAIGLVLIAAYFLVLRKPYGVLFSNLRSVDAATIVSDLEKKKIPYRLEDGGTTILAPTDQIAATRLAVATEDLPLKGVVGFELFNKSDMGLTEFAQRINYQRALQGELARTVMSMDSIEEARVHLTIAEPSVFRDERQPSKASVTLLARPGKEITPAAVRGIQRLVAAAVPDLAVGDVVVLDQAGETVSSDAPVQAPASPIALQKEAIELYYTAILRQALASLYPGSFDVTVIARTGPSPTAIDGAPAELSAWTPSSRAFPLDVAVSFAAPPTPEVQAQVRTLASKAISLDAAKGDVVTISAAPIEWNAPQPATASAAPIPASAASRRAPAGPGLLWLGVLAPLLVGLVALAAWLQWPRRAPRALSAAQRGELVRRLQILVDQEDPHATAS